MTVFGMILQHLDPSCVTSSQCLGGESVRGHMGTWVLIWYEWGVINGRKETNYL